MKLVIPKGATSRIITVFIQASNVTTGAGLGSLTNASSIVGGYVREGGTGVALAVDEDVTTEGTYQAPSAAGKVRIGTPANMRSGTYELHFHNDLWATGAETVTITLGGATNMADIALEVQLSDPVRGLGAPTALPNAAADAAGGLPISDAGGLDLDAQVVTKINSILDDTGTAGVVVASIAANAITAAAIANGAIDAATFAADVDAEILSYLVDDATRIDASALNTAAVTTIPAILDDTDLIDDATSGLAKIATDVAAVLVDTSTTLDDKIDAIQAKTDNLPTDPADESSIQATLATIAAYVDTEVAAIKAKTDNLPASPAAVGSAMTLTSAYDFAKGTAAMTEAYAANGAAPTPAQALFAIHQVLMQFAIAGTTNTVKKLDNSTTAFEITLDDDTNPTSAARV